MSVSIRDLLILAQIPGVGPNRLRAIVSHFNDTSIIRKLPAKELVAIEGIDKKLALSITHFFKNGSSRKAERYADDQLSRLNKVNGSIVSLWGDGYPEILKRIYDPPPYLFVRGSLCEIDSFSIGVVGTRSPSHYGIHMAEVFSSGLSAVGIPITSGLARGIDTVAHSATLDASGRTIAVIGSGVDVVYPAENRKLFERIVESGAVISEFAMATKPDAGNFPRRNRIISGMSLGTLVIETGVNGGAMITASMALDQNRDVFAIPSAVNPQKQSGTNLLIREGKALLVETVDDILTELSPRLRKVIQTPQHIPSPPHPPLSLFEQNIYDSIGDTPIHIDTIAQKTRMAISDALVHLLSLEFKGVVKQLRGKMFVRGW